MLPSAMLQSSSTTKTAKVFDMALPRAIECVFQLARMTVPLLTEGVTAGPHITRLGDP